MELNQITNTNTTIIVDKYVTLQFFKEKRTTRTYIVGLEEFMDNEKIKAFVHDVKKKLGTAIFEKMDEKKVLSYGFNGDHRTKITELLIASGINKDRIKIANS